MHTLRIFALLLLSYSLQATHNRAGEITYTQIDAFTIEATIATYTKASSLPADRDSLEICWGDGTCQSLTRVNGLDNDNNGIPDGELIGNDVKRNLYVQTHTYSAFGDYTMSMTDPTRNGGILNVNYPGSDQIPFHIETTFTLSSDINHSPSFLIYPIDIGFVGTPFFHSAAVFDFEGDSIFYELITPLQEFNTPVSNYVPANMIGSPQGILTLDSETGLLMWDSPNMVGEYVIAIQVTSFKNGVIQDQIIRDIQIVINSGENDLCEITIDPTWTSTVIDVTVGDAIQIPVSYEEFNENQLASLLSFSGLYGSTFISPASFTLVNQTSNAGQALFEWVVGSDQIREQPYQVVFKATDDLGSANFEIVQFRVMDELSNVDPVNQSDSISIFPNPSSDYLFLKDQSIQGVQYDILNSSGQSIQTGIIKDSSIEIMALPSGNYFLTIPSMNMTEGFIKQ